MQLSADKINLVKEKSTLTAELSVIRETKQVKEKYIFGTSKPMDELLKKLDFLEEGYREEKDHAKLLQNELNNKHK